MAFRDLVRSSRQESRLPVPVGAKAERSVSHLLLSLHREVTGRFDKVFRSVDLAGFGSFGHADFTLPKSIATIGNVQRILINDETRH